MATPLVILRSFRLSVLVRGGKGRGVDSGAEQGQAAQGQLRYRPGTSMGLVEEGAGMRWQGPQPQHRTRPSCTGPPIKPGISAWWQGPQHRAFFYPQQWLLCHMGLC
jgi:hypothetical protein